MELAYCLPREMGQLVRCSFKPTSTHRFKQEGCLSLGLKQRHLHNFLPQHKEAIITHNSFMALKDILTYH